MAEIRNHSESDYKHKETCCCFVNKSLEEVEVSLNEADCLLALSCPDRNTSCFHLLLYFAYADFLSVEDSGCQRCGGSCSVKDV